MSGFQRRLQRQKAKAEGTLLYKKKIARKFGISVSELDKRLKRREKNIRELNGEGGVEDGKR